MQNGISNRTRGVADAWRAARHAIQLGLFVHCWLSTGFAAAADFERVIDNSDPSAFTLRGSWTVGTGAPNAVGGTYHFTRFEPRTKKRAFYFLDPPEQGRYALAMRWPAASDRASAVAIDIVHATGVTTKQIDQRLINTEWVELGDYAFLAHRGQLAVRVLESPGVVVADAVRITRLNTDPRADAPLCPSHDDRAWHGLWDSTRGCHYTHTHNANPNDPAIVAILGPTERYLAGKTISYPWQTHNHAGVAENTAKHNGYKWLVDVNLPPLFLRLNWLNTPTPNAVRAVRTQYHFLSTNADARVRLHSFWAEMQICPTATPTNCGIVRGGGLWDTGILHAPYKQAWVPLPDQDPPGMIGKIWRPGVDAATGGLTIDPYRAHSHRCEDLGVFDGTVNANLDNAVLWTSAPGVFGYNRHLGIFVKVFDAAECLYPADTSRDIPICADGQCRFNGSEHVPFTYWAYVDPALDGGVRDRDGRRDGRVNFNGFTDPAGRIDDSCTATSETCVPYVLENAPIGWAAWETPSNDGHWPERYRDFDVSPPGVWWIERAN
jgi:hypothetical protein